MADKTKAAANRIKQQSPYFTKAVICGRNAEGKLVPYYGTERRDDLCAVRIELSVNELVAHGKALGLASEAQLESLLKPATRKGAGVIEFA